MAKYTLSSPNNDGYLTDLVYFKPLILAEYTKKDVFLMHHRALKHVK